MLTKDAAGLSQPAASFHIFGAGSSPPAKPYFLPPKRNVVEKHYFV
jgi:hypothetical protein